MTVGKGAGEVDIVVAGNGWVSGVCVASCKENAGMNGRDMARRVLRDLKVKKLLQLWSEAKIVNSTMNCQFGH